MTDLSKDIISAIKESGSAVAKSMDRLSGSVDRSREEATQQSYETQSAIREMRLTGSGGGGGGTKNEAPGGFGVLIGLAGIMFGLMTPLYIMMSGTNSAVSVMQDQMLSDNDRERTDAASFSSLQGSLVEIETQFRNDRFRLDAIDAAMLKDDDREALHSTAIDTLAEKVRALSLIMP